MLNVVSNVCYENVQDVEKVNQAVAAIEDPVEKRDFEINAQRISVPNMYRLFVESLGIYQNNDLIKQASGYIQSKIALIRSHIDGVGEFNGSLLSKEESSMQT